MPRRGEQAGRQAVRSATLGLLGPLGLAGVVLLIWLIPPALYKHVGNEPTRVGAEASTRTGLIAGLAALAALGGLAITARSYRLSEGHLTDRYAKREADQRRRFFAAHRDCRALTRGSPGPDLLGYVVSDAELA